MRHLLTLAVLLCAAVPALAAPSAPVNPMDWVGPMVMTQQQYSAVSDDGRILAVTDGSGDVCIVNLQQQRIISHCLPTIYDRKGRTYSFFAVNNPMMCLNDDGTILAFSHGRNITLWDSHTGKLITRLTLDTKITSFVFVPRTSHLLVATVDGVLRTLDHRSLKWTGTKNIGEAVYCLAVLTDANRWAGYTDADTLVMINPDDYSYDTYPAVIGGNSSNITLGWGSWIGYDAHFKRIIAFMPSGALAYWQWPSMKLISTADSTHNIGCISSKGVLITEDRTFFPVIRDINMSLKLKIDPPNNSRKSCFSTSGNFAVMSRRSPMKIDLRDNRVSKSSFPDRGSILEPLIYAETSLHKSLAKETNKVLPNIYSSYQRANVSAIAGKYRLYQDYEGPMKLEEISTGKQLAKCPQIDDGLGRLLISMSNDARLISIVKNGKIAVREVKSTKYLDLPEFPAEVYLGEMSSDGHLLAIGSFDYPAPPIDEFGRGSTLFIAKPGSKQVLCKLFPHQGYVIAARFNKDGSRIVSIDEANSLRMWDCRTGQLLYTRPNAGTDVFFDSSSTRLIAWSTADTFDLLDASTGKFLARSWRYQNGKYATVTPDGLYDGDKESCNTILWSMDAGRISTLSNSGLTHKTGLWGALTK